MPLQEMGCLSEDGKDFCVETTAGCPVTCRDEAPGLMKHQIRGIVLFLLPKRFCRIPD